MTPLLWFLLLILSWCGCGIISAGIYYADFQREYPTIANRCRESDTNNAFLFAFGGPCSLVVGLVGSNFMRHGWLLPGRKP